MTREEVYSSCLQEMSKCNCLLLELPTGFGKTKLSIDLVNSLVETMYKDKGLNVLLLVAKTVHKQTWKDEIEKWGGIKSPSLNLCMECYESLKNHCREHWDIILMDEVHHVGSELRLSLFKTMSFGYMIGLSATIPKKLKQLFQWRYKAKVVSCELTEAVEEDILPEPEIVLWPLELEKTRVSEEIILNPKIKSPIVVAQFKDIWKYKKMKTVRAIIKCTQQQKMNELNSQISWMKDQYMRTRSKIKEQSWLYLCGKRLEFLADCKLQLVKELLVRLKGSRTITFCKTIGQAEKLGTHCIHSKNKEATAIYDDFNKKKIRHITAVNILNENANLVDCKYAIFTNLSSSEIVSCQRIGRSLRHKSPVIIIPYYKDTREQEIMAKMIEGFKKVRTIKSIKEL